MAIAPPAQLLWIDPGGMSGFAMLSNGQFWSDEYPFDRACARLLQLCHWYGEKLHVGYEKFTIGPSTHKLSPQWEAYEFPGFIKGITAHYGCVLLPPAMPDARLTATPKMLQAINWWPQGKDDAQSACQHMLSWMMREGCVPDDLARAIAQRTRSR